MSTSWRISSFNGVLLAAYFIPTWTIVAFNIMVSPVHSLFDRPSIAVGLFITDHLHLAGTGAVRAAWLLALGRLVVVAFFAIFVLLAFTPKIRKFGGCDEGAHNADEAASPPTNYQPAPIASQEQQLQLIPIQEQEQHQLQQLNLSLRSDDRSRSRIGSSCYSSSFHLMRQLM